MIKKILAFTAVLALAASLAGCAEEEKIVTVGEGDWDSNAFHDQVVKVIVEEGYGVEMDIVTADTPVMVSGLKTNDIDFVLELWSDNIPTYDEDIENGDYQFLSVNFDDNTQGIYVPAYLVEGDDAPAAGLKTVEDLKDYAHLFPDPEEPEKGIIYGGPEGWEATDMLHKKMAEYGLDEYFNFKPIDSNATLTATLSGAYTKGEPWVGYNWEPTWVMGLYDMHLLEDAPYTAEDFEKGIGAFPSVSVNVMGSNEFVEEYPELVDFLSSYTTSSELTSNGLAYMQSEGVEADAAAKWFLKENVDLWKPMVTQEAYDKIMKALESEE